jgi:hypothetical protein
MTKPRTDLADLDQILAFDEHVSPSGGFAAAVMEAVEAAASEPPPLPFPWRPFASGVLGCLAWAASGVWLLELISAPATRVIATVMEFTAPLEYAGVALLGCLAIAARHRMRGNVTGIA